jgi:ABC-2 type transport system ATP-binding protein
VTSAPPGQPGETVVEIAGLSKRFGSAVLAVDDLTFTVERGQVVGLLGPNGAGKTTCLRMLLGLIRPTAGEAKLFGTTVRPGSRELLRVGALIESAAFVPHLSGMQNLRMWWEEGGAKWRDADLDAALAIADLGNAIDRKVKTYSQGMRQRLGLARVLLGRPEILVLDEPTNGLDPQGTREVRHLIAELAADGTTVFVSSHLLAEVEQLCTHLGVMRAGTLVAQGPMGELRALTATRFRMRTRDPQPALAVLANLGVADAVLLDGGVGGSLGEVAPEWIVQAMVRAGITVAEFVQVTPTLEDLFVQLTGEGFDVSG